MTLRSSSGKQRKKSKKTSSVTSVSASFKQTDLVFVLVPVSFSSPSSPFLFIHLIHTTLYIFCSVLRHKLHLRLTCYVFLCVLQLWTYVLCPQFPGNSCCRLRNMIWMWCVFASKFSYKMRPAYTTPHCLPSSPTPSMTTVSSHK